jgi:predicted GH43/DUF377 family glycosyl hydrolase
MKNSSINIPNNLIHPISIAECKEGLCLLYQSKRRGNAKLSAAISKDGITFAEKTDQTPLIMGRGNNAIPSDSIENVHFASIAGKETLSFSLAKRLTIAENNEDWEIPTWDVLTSKLPDGAQNGLVLSEYKHRGEFVLIYDNGKSLYLSLSKDLNTWHGPRQAILSPRSYHFDNNNLKVVTAKVTKTGIVVLYQATVKNRKNTQIRFGLALLDHNNPTQLIWRTEGPVWQTLFKSSIGLRTIGANINDQEANIWMHSKKGSISCIKINIPIRKSFKPPKTPSLSLEKHPANPLIGPEGGQNWEAIGTFNPAILHDNDEVHILYRALDPSGMSYIGYAKSSDGVNIDYRSPTPAYWPRASFEAGDGVRYYDNWSDQYASGGGWGGCEDPKVTLIDGFVYITYVAHPGWGPPRIAMSRIEIDDFRDRKWDKWEYPRLISEPGVVNKSGIILPEKIDGQYVIFHRVFPNILIHYTDDLNKLGKSEWLESHDYIPPRPDSWDSRKLSIGSTPIKIDEGWLVIYHAVDDSDDSKYKIGAMILDYQDPSKVVARTNHPILEPTMDYENEWKAGIAYPSGAAVINGVLHVYYGGGDRHVCVATAPLQEFVNKLLTHQDVKLIQEVEIQKYV